MNTLGAIGMHVVHSIPYIFGENEATRMRMSGALYLQSDVTSAADLGRSTPYGWHHRMTCTVYAVKNECL